MPVSSVKEPAWVVKKRDLWSRKVKCSLEGKWPRTDQWKSKWKEHRVRTRHEEIAYACQCGVIIKTKMVSCGEKSVPKISHGGSGGITWTSVAAIKITNYEERCLGLERQSFKGNKVNVIGMGEADWNNWYTTAKTDAHKSARNTGLKGKYIIMDNYRQDKKGVRKRQKGKWESVQEDM